MCALCAFVVIIHNNINFYQTEWYNNWIMSTTHIGLTPPRHHGTYS